MVVTGRRTGAVSFHHESPRKSSSVSWSQTPLAIHHDLAFPDFLRESSAQRFLRVVIDFDRHHFGGSPIQSPPCECAMVGAAIQHNRARLYTIAPVDIELLFGQDEGIQAAQRPLVPKFPLRSAPQLVFSILAYLVAAFPIAARILPICS